MVSAAFGRKTMRSASAFVGLGLMLSSDASSAFAQSLTLPSTPTPGIVPQ